MNTCTECPVAIRLVLWVVYLIVEDDLCRLCRTVDDVDARGHAILDGLLVMESEFDEGAK